MPKMRHESGGHQIEVAADQVPIYESQGWQQVGPKSAKKAAEPATSAAPEGDD